MPIKKGSHLLEHADAVYMEDKFSKELMEDFLLLLEGSDDILVIKKIYELKSEPMKFRLLKANDENIEEKTIAAGKKNALNVYDDLKSKGRNIACLLDRDYDFHLNEQRNDKYIKYYDYYELENYIFEEKILRLLIGNIYSYSNDDEFFGFLNYFKKIEEACKPYMLLCYFREVNFRENILEEDKMNKLLKIIDKKPTSMMQMQNIEEEDKLNKIKSYIDENLKCIDLSIEKIQNLIVECGYDYNRIMNDNDVMFGFKFNVKGKMILNCLDVFANYIFEICPELRNKKSKGDLSNLGTRLKLEWIPTSCNSLSRLLVDIEKLFIA